MNWAENIFKDNSSSMPDFLSIHELQNISYPALEKQEEVLRGKIRELNDELVTLLVSRDELKTEQDAVMADCEDLQALLTTLVKETTVWPFPIINTEFVFERSNMWLLCI